MLRLSTSSGLTVKLREDCLAYSVSPDGTTIAFTTGELDLREEIWVMDVGGAAQRRIVSSQNGAIFYSLHWSPNGRRIAYRKQDIETGKVVVESTPIERGPPVLLAANGYAWGDFCWLPGGRLIFSTLGRYQTKRQSSNSA